MRNTVEDGEKLRRLVAKGGERESSEDRAGHGGRFEGGLMED